MDKQREINKENVLLQLDGTYNSDVHKKLSAIIHNIASNKARTNKTLDVEDLSQEAWVQIYNVINLNLQKNRELEIAYLVRVAQTTILGYCEKTSKQNENVDDLSSCLLSSSDKKVNDIRNSANIGKSKLEYSISTRKLNEDDASILRLSLEDILESLEDELVRNLIIIKYIKEVNGTSPRITRMYLDFYNSIDADRQAILDNMDKFTNRDAFRAMGMRATDNSSTRVRNEMKRILEVLI